MAGQLSSYGAQAMVNRIANVVTPVASASTSPPTWVPGLVWYNTTAAAFSYWNGSAWVTGTEPLYLALLTSDPSQAATQNGGYAMTIADLVEDTTAGYARQAVTFAEPPVYSGSTTYTLGQIVFYNNYLFQCAVTSVSGTAPSGSEGVSNSTWTYYSNGYPAVVTNTATITWTYTAAQALPVGWAALVNTASGTTGLLKYMWTLPTPQQVQNSQSIQIGIGSLTLGQS